MVAVPTCEAWKEVTTNAEPPEKVMSDFVDWLEGLGKQPVFVAHPTGYDFAMVAWYLWKFPHKNPFTNKQGAPVTLDLSSFIAGKFGGTLEQSKRTNLPDWMREGMPGHSHNALDDARGFAVILRNVIEGDKT